jgi:hypothetical protein
MIVTWLCIMNVDFLECRYVSNESRLVSMLS